MHDGTGRCVLQPDFLFRMQELLDGERRQGCFMETAEDQFFLSRIRVNVPYGKDSGNTGLELLRVNLDLALCQLHGS